MKINCLRFCHITPQGSESRWLFKEWTSSVRQPSCWDGIEVGMARIGRWRRWRDDGNVASVWKMVVGRDLRVWRLLVCR